MGVFLDPLALALVSLGVRYAEAMSAAWRNSGAMVNTPFGEQQDATPLDV